MGKGGGNGNNSGQKGKHAAEGGQEEATKGQERLRHSSASSQQNFHSEAQASLQHSLFTLQTELEKQRLEVGRPPPRTESARGSVDFLLVIDGPIRCANQALRAFFFFTPGLPMGLEIFTRLGFVMQG